MADPVDQFLQAAIAHQQGGRLDEAALIYQEILSHHPQHPDALHLMGMLARRRGNKHAALSLLTQAVAVHPSAQFRSNLGIVLMESGNTAEAIREFKLAVETVPHYAKGHSNLGSALMANGDPQKAADAFALAIQYRPDLFEAYVGLAGALRSLDRLSESVTVYRKAITLRPDLPQAHVGLGHALSGLGLANDAVESYRSALKITPENAEAFNGLGNALAMLDRFEEAEAAFGSALTADPDAGGVWNNIGNLFRTLKRDDEALNAYRHAVAANPRLGGGYNNLGNALRERGEVEESITAFRRAVELDSKSPAIHSNLVYAVCFDPAYDAEQILSEARTWAERHESPLLATNKPHTNDPHSDRPLRIGYVSGDFRDHVIGRNVLPILENHNRDQFQVHCFSTLIRHDSTTGKYVRAADRWHECATLGSSELAEKVRAEQIDILVDLTLHMAGNRLMVFARKPAPVQVTWAGYPGTTGLRSIDYRITDPYVDPPGSTDAFYSERSIRMPHSFWCYRPSEAAPDVNPLPALANGFITFGCLNSCAKVTRLTLSLWSKVLLAVEKSHLLILAPEGSLRKQIADFFHAHGVDPGRIEFVGPALPSEHLGRYHRIDICLDPQPYTGHTTTLDGLWMGVPAVTLSGQTSVARGSVTALKNVGLEDWITFNQEQYITTAATLAGHLPHLTALRSAVRDRLRSSPICDEKQFTKALEGNYRSFWKQWASKATG